MKEITIPQASSIIFTHLPKLQGLEFAVNSIKLKSKIDKVISLLREKNTASEIFYITSVYDVVLKKYEPDNEQDLEDLIEQGPEVLLGFLLDKASIDEKIVFCFLMENIDTIISNLNQD